MLILTTVTSLAAAVSTPASPSTSTSTVSPPPHDGGGFFQPFPISTTIRYYHTGGWPNDNTMCLVPRGNGTIYASTCTEITYASIYVDPVPDNNCTLTIYVGSTTCAGDAVKEGVGGRGGVLVFLMR
ncbi:hypothetical protein LTR56_022411 [Elasticomyces elasticus]|nr:hypothetical protein LTR56_022411 [Elasticomyces elasticus]KAK3633029.1 hypothetical protein LTR22_020347 [Elasticomyces elasticus]KAK4932714.1 hypothetical protein LTR49_001138 [Elasticomyces elasticus]KAK5769736.1 hypothetical protein LTS12_000186 [Elasticomyces elasticus]